LAHARAAVRDATRSRNGDPLVPTETGEQSQAGLEGSPFPQTLLPRAEANGISHLGSPWEPGPGSGRTHSDRKRSGKAECGQWRPFPQSPAVARISLKHVMVPPSFARAEPGLRSGPRIRKTRYGVCAASRETAATEPSMSLNVSSWHNSASSAVSRALCNPWIDRSVALVAVVPFAYTLGHDISRFGFNIAWLVANANFVMLVLAMVIRRPPTRVTPNPAYWLLAFVATYWVFLVDHFVTPGPAAVPDL